MKQVIILLILSMISLGATADPREDKIRTLMEAQGLIGMFQQQLEMGRAQSKQQAKQIMDQVMAQLPPSNDYQDDFAATMKRFMDNVQPPWTAEEIVSQWAKFYGAGFSDSELDELLAFYTSAIGRKEVQTTKTALVKFTTHFQKISQPLLKKATEAYIADLKALLADIKKKQHNH